MAGKGLGFDEAEFLIHHNEIKTGDSTGIFDFAYVKVYMLTKICPRALSETSRGSTREIQLADMTRVLELKGVGAQIGKVAHVAQSLHEGFFTRLALDL